MTTGTPGVQVYFFGVGGSGRRPVRPPTPSGSGVGVRCERCGRARGSDTVRWKSRENDIVGPGAEVPKGVLVGRVDYLRGAWRRWGAESGKPMFSLSKTKDSEGPG